MTVLTKTRYQWNSGTGAWATLHQSWASGPGRGYAEQRSTAPDGDLSVCYQGFPEGLTYVGSWIEANFDRCFQLMECDDPRLLQEWILNCQGLGMTFEIVPVVPSKETREVVAPFLEPR